MKLSQVELIELKPSKNFLKKHETYRSNRQIFDIERLLWIIYKHSKKFVVIYKTLQNFYALSIASILEIDGDHKKLKQFIS